jgi:hypothetical protein
VYLCKKSPKSGISGAIYRQTKKPTITVELFCTNDCWSGCADEAKTFSVTMLKKSGANWIFRLDGKCGKILG